MTGRGRGLYRTKVVLCIQRIFLFAIVTPKELSVELTVPPHPICKLGGHESLNPRYSLLFRPQVERYAVFRRIRLSRGFLMAPLSLAWSLTGQPVFLTQNQKRYTLTLALSRQWVTHYIFFAVLYSLLLFVW